MAFIDLLSADTALVKTFSLNNGVVEKSPYPMVRDFTSHRREVTDIVGLFNVLEEGASQGWCLSKGPLTQPITNESRAGKTDATTPTQLLILDFDGLDGYRDIESALEHCGLAHFSHVIQWSASAWLSDTTTHSRRTSTPQNPQPQCGREASPSASSAATTGSGQKKNSQKSGESASSKREPTSNESNEPIGTLSVSHTTASQQAGGQAKLSAHVLFWVQAGIAPSLVKSWLMQLNLRFFATSITLTRTGSALHWPIDPSVADNSKLIYIAPPRLLGGLQPPSPAPTIMLVERDHAVLPTTLFTVNPQEVAQERQKLLSDLREKAGLKRIKDSQFTYRNGQTYMSKPGEATITGVKRERGFVYLNLNGGDSWGYYHPEDNTEYIYNFKGEPVYKTAELLPEYFASLSKLGGTEYQGQVRYFVCRDFRTDRLYNGAFYVDEDRLVMARAANEGRLKSFLKQHGQPVQDFVPDFDITYDPHDKRKFDLEGRFINTYVPSRFEALPRREQTTVPPMIQKVIESAVGSGENYEHFLNWLADIVQFKEKIGTAWVLHGNEGTGKGVLFHRVIKPLIGAENVAAITMRDLDSTFNGFLEKALVIFVDEVQISAAKGALSLSAQLRNFITEKVLSIRRMYSEPYNAPNYTNFVFASNMPDPVVVPPTDRRFHVGTFQPAKLVLSETDLHVLDSQVEDFYFYLASRTVDRTRTKEILASEDRERLMKLSQTAADLMAETILSGDIEDLVVNMPQHSMLPSEAAYTALVKQFLIEKPDKLSRDELLTIFQYRVGKEVPESPNKFTSFLKHHRLYTRKMRFGERTLYGISVTWNKDAEWMQQALVQLGVQPSTPQANVSPIKKAKVAAT